MRRVTTLCFSVLAASMHAAAQQPDMAAVLERLERLERQNLELMDELRALRRELAGKSGEPETAVPLLERVEVSEKRIEEQAEAKVEASQKALVRLTGMVLFNAYANSAHSGTAENPTVAALSAGPRSAGAYMRQSLVGLEFNPQQRFAGAKLSGSLHMDFFAGSSSTLNHLMRIRTAALELDWGNTSFKIAQEKPIFSPRDPTSLAQVGVSPLTNAGNPWLWQPQAVIEQRFTFGEESGLRAQVGVFQSNELATIVPAPFTATLERSRPALEGRFAFRHRNLEVAPGFHLATTHVAGTSVPSNAASVDWFYSPRRGVELTGLAYLGANLAGLGTLRQGFTVLGPRHAIAIRSRGGWAQLALTPASRLSFHLIAGQHDDNNRDLRFGGIGKNEAYAANVMYRVGSNFIVAIEGSQVRTAYLPGPVRRNNHYDLAFGYLF